MTNVIINKANDGNLKRISCSKSRPLLFSADGNTRVWQGYEAIGEPVLQVGQMHDFRRCLY